MTTALYRRYRPDTFASVIGQDHVTGPLRAALRANKVTHAYLFSGPRGCGKTTSARILARCLNCEQGPTDTPCGTCPSCVELATGGSGSLDVVEIDAASHGGVDDARDLRERATFAPVRDRYKIFIIDEAHMVTNQGFNALLKLVEEPPEHVKFVFATTEPERVIGTIRSRTHHYPFRLVPPDVLEPYLQQLADEEHVNIGSGVLPLVMRAGGGSVRDTLSVLDQLMAGSIDSAVTYETAVSLLGYTDSALLDEIVDALAGGDGAAAYRVIERMVDSGHDPRRFVEDFLQTLRDLLIIAVAGDGAGDVLTSIPAERLDRMRHQAVNWGPRPLSRAADLTDEALRSMTGATSPRLQLELLIGRILVPTPSGQAVADMPVPGTVGMPGGGAPREHHGADYAGNKPIGAAPSASGPQAARAALAQTTQRASRPDSNQQDQPADLAPRAQAPSSPHRDGAPVSNAPTPMPQQGSSWPDVTPTPSSSWDDSPVAQSQNSAPAVEPEEPAPAPQAEPQSVGAASSTEAPARQTPRQNGGKQADIVRARWNEVLDRLASMSRVAWSLINTNAQLGAIDGSNLVLVFPSEGIMANFERGGRHQIVSDAIYEVTGLRYELSAQVGQASGGPAVTAPSAPASHHAYSDPTYADQSYSGQTQNVPLNNTANRGGQPDAGWVSEPPPFEHRVVQAPDVGSQAVGDPPAPRVAPDPAPHVGSDPVVSDDPWGEVVIRTPHEDVEEPAQAREPEPQDGLSESQQVHNDPQPSRDDAWSAGAESASTWLDSDPAGAPADSSPGFKVHSDSSATSDDRSSDGHGDDQADSESLTQAEPVRTGGPVRRAMSVFTYDDFDPQNASDDQVTTPSGWADAPVAQTNSVSFEDFGDTAQSAGDSWTNGDNSAGSGVHNDGSIDDSQDSAPLDMGEDLPSMDDEDIETTTMVGVPVVLDVLGGKIIETIPNGSER